MKKKKKIFFFVLLCLLKFDVYFLFILSLFVFFVIYLLKLKFQLLIFGFVAFSIFIQNCMLYSFLDSIFFVFGQLFLFQLAIFHSNFNTNSRACFCFSTYGIKHMKFFHMSCFSFADPSSGQLNSKLMQHYQYTNKCQEGRKFHPFMKAL